MKPINHSPSNLFFQLFFTWGLFFFYSFDAQAQVTVQLTVMDGEATTTCGDGLFAGDPTWGVMVENEGWVTYSKENCAIFSDYPSQQFERNLTCLSDLRGGEIQVCFRAFDNETTLFNPCNDSDRDCEVPICMNFLLPFPGSDSIYTLTIPNGLASGGSVDFMISVSDDPNAAKNDRICHAIDLGKLSKEGIIGNAALGQFNNYCATGISEPSPHQAGARWQNNVATWFSFTTSNNPNALVLVEARSDPQGQNDPINLQLALYNSMDETCTGELEFIRDNDIPTSFDGFLLLDCLTPNRQYYIMVDGENATEESTFGIFGMQVREADIAESFGDDICDATPIEVVEGGMLYENFFNNCATNTNDPPITNFASNNSVWFEFSPNESRRVEIFVISDLAFPQGIDPIDVELAVYYSPANNCTGSLVEVTSNYSGTDGKDEFLRLECLNPKLRYWLLVDGSNNDPTGVFDMLINDPGYPKTITMDTTICEGDILVLGNKSYVNQGVYLDTIITNEDCLKIIETDLKVVPPISVRLIRERIASAFGAANGIEIVSVSGGTGNYSIEWSNGQMNQVATGLIGGNDYCVTVSDAAGCERKECFTMEYIIPIVANIKNDTVNCFNDANGQLSINVIAGQTPYSYTVQGIEDPSIIKTGVITKNDTNLIINDLPVGRYNVFIKNEFTVSNLTGVIETPLPLKISLKNQINATCFGNCDGVFEVEVTGGNGDYQFVWDNGIQAISNPNGICAGDYLVTVSDAKNCKDSLQLSIQQPEKTIIEARQIEPVQCFGEGNGQATINSNETPTAFLWDNGETTEIAANLAAGIHEVTITTGNNCESTASIEINQPEAAIEASINIVEAIACGGDSNGILAATITGGNNNYQYNWTNNKTSNLNDNLVVGEYFLTVTDEKGCEDVTSIQLDEPVPIEASISTQDVTCPGGENSGVINVDNIVGGTMPYRFSLDGGLFTSTSNFMNLKAGEYDLFVEDDNGCEQIYPQAINNPPEVTVSIGANIEIKLGDIIDLEAVSNRAVAFEWSTSDSLDCMDCAMVSSQPFTNATYKVKATDLATGCVAEDVVKVMVLKERNVFVPNVFSPNGDGQNDKLMVFGGNDIEEVMQFKIFDRKGSLIYEANNFQLNDFNTGWDGLYNGQRLLPDVFIYFAEVRFIDKEVFLYKGDIALIK